MFLNSINSLLQSSHSILQMAEKKLFNASSSTIGRIRRRSVERQQCFVQTLTNLFVTANVKMNFSIYIIS